MESERCGENEGKLFVWQVMKPTSRDGKDRHERNPATKKAPKCTIQNHKFLLPYKTATANFIMFTWDVGLSLKETLTVLYIVGKKKGYLQSFWEHMFFWIHGIKAAICAIRIYVLFQNLSAWLNQISSFKNIMQCNIIQLFRSETQPMNNLFQISAMRASSLNVILKHKIMTPSI